jgi:RNA polymerase primary sigma factor
MRQLKVTKRITNRDDSSLEKYLGEISKIERINTEEEGSLTQRIKAGDQQAYDKLVRANLRFVVSVAKQYQHQGLLLSDLINEGNLGLIKAAGRFDETRGFKFISYAVWWIRQSILQALAEQGRLVRLPQNKVSFNNKVNRTSLVFEQEFEREPTAEELAVILETDIYTIELSTGSHLYHTSLDAPVSGTEDITHADLLQSESSPDSILNSEDLKKDIYEALSILDDKEREIIMAYYGIQGTKEDMEKKYDLTGERIRQIKEKAIRRLQKRKVVNLLQKHLG